MHRYLLILCNIPQSNKCNRLILQPLLIIRVWLISVIVYRSKTQRHDHLLRVLPKKIKIRHKKTFRRCIMLRKLNHRTKFNNLLLFDRNLCKNTPSCAGYPRWCNIELVCCGKLFDKKLYHSRQFPPRRNFLRSSCYHYHLR